MSMHSACHCLPLLIMRGHVVAASYGKSAASYTYCVCAPADHFASCCADPCTNLLVSVFGYPIRCIESFELYHILSQVHWYWHTLFWMAPVVVYSNIRGSKVCSSSANLPLAPHPLLFCNYSFCVLCHYPCAAVVISIQFSCSPFALARCFLSGSQFDNAHPIQLVRYAG